MSDPLNEMNQKAFRSSNKSSKKDLFSKNWFTPPISLKKQTFTEGDHNVQTITLMIEISNEDAKELSDVRLTHFIPKESPFSFNQVEVDQTILPDTHPGEGIDLGTISLGQTKQLIFQSKVDQEVDLSKFDSKIIVTFKDKKHNTMYEFTFSNKGALQLEKSPFCNCPSLQDCSCEETSYKIVADGDDDLDFDLDDELDFWLD
ncbi:hypothetical protein [Thermoflavimicrobium dichotomicum]|uniref:Uncharacterized protein n=1 Tax=Thermoflavimicrobium dichotomicum TaxID=46223 RepID=A0A1I3PKY1_9BACL|nr:hypothetical protein [Thermoflavimicrobium dichotomicum]SFJ22364.1 hypothetical protein SAMN05421852_10622 [Thermoflavimicrobium dichotomicum]